MKKRIPGCGIAVRTATLGGMAVSAAALMLAGATAAAAARPPSR
jgi:hypothetical protein